MLCLYILLIYCWGGLGDLIEKLRMVGLRTCILLRKIKRHPHLYQCLIDKCMKAN
jgi:hypothetical protein